MKWNEVRQHYPHQWLLLEAVEAHSSAGKRVLDELAVLDDFLIRRRLSALCPTSS